MDSLNILMDPIYSNRPSPVTWMGPTRRHAPGLAIVDLPPIDVILLSHNHYDHTDLPSLDTLVAAHNPEVITGLGLGPMLEKVGATRIRQLDWGSSTTIGSIVFTGETCRHFSGRGLNDGQRNLWMSYVLSGQNGRVYFAGDTGYGDQFRAAKDAYGDFDLALLPIGAYEPRWFMETLHLNPEEAVRAHLELGATHSLGIHFCTFRLSEEGQDTPIIDLAQARLNHDVDEAAFRTLLPGKAWTIDRHPITHPEP